MLFAQVLGNLLEQKEITAYRLAKETGLSQSLISDWRKGKTIPSSDKLMTLSRFFGVSIDYLLDNPPAAFQPTEAVRIPIYGSIFSAETLGSGKGIERYIDAQVENPEEYFYLSMAGSSMSASGILSNATVLVHRQDTACDGQIVACLPMGKTATFRRFRCCGDAALLLPEGAPADSFVWSGTSPDLSEAALLGVAVSSLNPL
ncbi:helix-turn-helix domain-containing protein [Oscillospiraceae bacterium MB08-C2-2]|nr:helix-turn-helix domain-containing protein [Oscillospiraceae bacterium MB08-C2-2]